jgi:hypothetical protein
MFEYSLFLDQGALYSAFLWALENQFLSGFSYSWVRKERFFPVPLGKTSEQCHVKHYQGQIGR